MQRTAGRKVGAINFSKLQQTALFPGQAKETVSFDGQHTYSHSLQNREAFKESKAWILLASAVAAPFLAPVVLSGMGWSAAGGVMTSPLFWPAYVGTTAVSLRLIAKGKKNPIPSKDLTGKVVLLVGGTGDIGRVVAKELLRNGATVVIASRSDQTKVDATRAYLEKECGLPPANMTESSVEVEVEPPSRLYFKSLDLNYLSSIRQFCSSLRAEHPTIHMIVNTSGVMYEHEHINKFGDEEQLSTNVLGPYLLIESLLPEIQATRGRIVHVSSSAQATCSEKVVHTYLSHKKGLWNPKDEKNHKFDGIEQYGFTKLCNVFHAQELAARSYDSDTFATRQGFSGGLRKVGVGSIVERSGVGPSVASVKKPNASPSLLIESSKGSPELATKVASGDRRTASKDPGNKFAGKQAQYTACAANPGGVVTNLFRHMPFASKMQNKVLYPFFTLFMRTPQEGAQTILYCCYADDIVNGGYYQNCAYSPNALSKVACSLEERSKLMAWVKKRTFAVMDRQASWRPK